MVRHLSYPLAVVGVSHRLKVLSVVFPSLVFAVGPPARRVPHCVPLPAARSPRVGVLASCGRQPPGMPWVVTPTCQGTFRLRQKTCLSFLSLSGLCLAVAGCGGLSSTASAFGLRSAAFALASAELTEVSPRQAAPPRLAVFSVVAPCAMACRSSAVDCPSLMLCGAGAAKAILF